jgi:AcrR family transcriptional regulator
MRRAGGHCSDVRSKLSSEGHHDTIGRILSTAEVLFAEKGPEKTSLRELSATASVNLSAVGYHFGSKKKLEEAVYERVSARINKERIAELEDYMAIVQRKNQRPELETILQIFLNPYVGPGNEQQGVLLSRMMMRDRLAPSASTQRRLSKHFDPWATRFIAALILACPDVDKAEIYWRYTYMTSAISMIVTDRSKNNRIARLSGGIADATNNVELRRTLLRFLTGAMSSPSS